MLKWLDHQTMSFRFCTFDLTDLIVTSKTFACLCFKQQMLPFSIESYPLLVVYPT